MSIIEAIDAEITIIDTEVERLSERRRKLNTIRADVEALGEAGKPPPSDSGAPPVSSAPAVEKPRGNGQRKRRSVKKPAAKPASNGQVGKVVAFVLEHPGCRRAAILAATGLRAGTAKRLLAQAIDEGQVRKEGERAGTRYFPAGDGARPSDAPREPEPAPAPDHTGTRLPDRPRVSRGLSAHREAEKEAHNALRERVKLAIAELVKDFEPITWPEIVTMILEQIPEADRHDIQKVRTNLAKEGVISSRPDGYHFGREIGKPALNGAGPKTDLERRCLEAVKDIGLTASEVGMNLNPQIPASQASQVLEGMFRRGLLDRYGGDGRTVYEVKEAAAA